MPIVPGIMTVQNFEQTSSFAAKCGTSIPPRLAARFAGLEHDPHTRQLVAANVATEQVLGLVDAGVTDLHFYTMNRAELVYSICRLLDVHPIPDPVDGRGGAGMSISALRQAAAERILVLDGAMGTMIQGLGFDEDAYRGAQFDAWNRAVHGNNDLLNITQPDAIRSIHYAYFRAGADIVSTNTFSSTAIAQADYGMSELVYDLNRAGAALARDAALMAEHEKTAGGASSPAPSARRTGRRRSRPTCRIPGSGP